MSVVEALNLDAAEVRRLQLDFAGSLVDERALAQLASSTGLIVAGEIAGALDTGGIVGLAYDSQLVVAKVVAADGTIPIKAEAADAVISLLGAGVAK